MPQYFRHQTMIRNAQKTGGTVSIRGGSAVVENEGTATISVGSTSVTVVHGLGGIPTNVNVEPQSSDGVDHFVDTVTATTFNINLQVSPAADVTFYWHARRKQ